MSKHPGGSGCTPAIATQKMNSKNVQKKRLRYNFIIHHHLERSLRHQSDHADLMRLNLNELYQQSRHHRDPS